MNFYERFLEKWQQCCNSRYSVLLIITNSQSKFFPNDLLEGFINYTEATLMNYETMYEGELEQFFTWKSIRDEIYEQSKYQPVIVTELEPFYAKWPVEERISFLKNLIRSEPVYGIILILHCEEDLSELSAIKSNNRGLIWAP